MKRHIHHTPDFLTFAARTIRAAGRRVAEADPDQLADLVQLRLVLDEAIQLAVCGQRSTGITWQSIGEATGTSRQAAIMKWAAKCH